MNFNRICILLILLFHSYSAFSQVDSIRRDSIEEIIIYEYDTVYIQPDTIRITDTVFDIVKVESVKKTKPTRTRRSRNRNRDYTMTGFLPRSICFSAMPFICINSKTPSDSLEPEQITNLAYHFQLNYYTDRFLISYGLSYTTYHERFTGQYISFTSKIDTITSISYDSIKLTNNYRADYYYNYLGLDLIIGRKFIINKRLYFNLTAGASASLLMGYKQGNTAVVDSMLRKTSFSIILSPQVTYKISRKFEFKLSPFYKHSIFYEEKYPYSFMQRAGIEIGFNYVL
jgi:hypothetical protein